MVGKLGQGILRVKLSLAARRGIMCRPDVVYDAAEPLDLRDVPGARIHITGAVQASAQEAAGCASILS